MRPLLAALLGALAAAGALALVSSASGPPPAPDPGPPAIRTVVAHGTGVAKVARPARLNDRTIERAARRARTAAVPKAVAAARKEAATLSRAAGLRLSGPPGDWCGRWANPPA